METAVEPAEKRFQVSLFGPDGGYTIPAIQLVLEDLAADLGQMLEGLLFGFPLRQEVNRRLPSQVFQHQFRTRWIDSPQPLQKWQCWLDQHCASVDHLHSA